MGCWITIKDEKIYKNAFQNKIKNILLMFVSKLDTKNTTTIFFKYSKHSAGKYYLSKTAFILISLE